MHLQASITEHLVDGLMKITARAARIDLHRTTGWAKLLHGPDKSLRPLLRAAMHFAIGLLSFGEEATLLLR